MQAIHQLVAGYTGPDAISNEARALRALFRAWGCASEIYTDRAHRSAFAKDAHDAHSLAARCSSADIVVLHLSVGSPVNDIFSRLACRRVILYHNVTPAPYLEAVNPALAADLALGRTQALALAGTADVVLADSTFNARELETWGHRDVRVFPLVLDLDLLDGQVDGKTARRFADGLINVLFVGRCAPNKAIDDAVRAFAAYQRGFEAASRFIHVGSSAGLEGYAASVVALGRELGADNVELMGSRTPNGLRAAYCAADLFLCMSEHEGFCIPLLESMACDVPVLAYAAGAVPETLDGAGVLFTEKDFPVIAAMMHRLVSDATLRDTVLDGQRQRLARYRARDLGSELRGHLAPLMQGMGGGEP